MSVQKFLELADKEHDALSTYCNALSSLSHAISNKKPVLNSHFSPLDPINMIPMQSKEETALIEYMEALKNLQLCHSKIEQYLLETKETVTEHESKCLTEHVMLSKRALTTCASSASKGFGPLHENGLLKNLAGNGNDDWHEMRVVTLVSLRASISNLRNNIEAML
jgi:hypothetical protein